MYKDEIQRMTKEFHNRLFGHFLLNFILRDMIVVKLNYSNLKCSMFEDLLELK